MTENHISTLRSRTSHYDGNMNHCFLYKVNVEAGMSVDSASASMAVLDIFLPSSVLYTEVNSNGPKRVMGEHLQAGISECELSPTLPLHFCYFSKSNTGLRAW